MLSPGLAARSPVIRTPDDLKGFTLLHDESNAGDPLYPGWDDWLDKAGAHGVDASGGLRFSLSIMAMQAAVDGQGVLLGRTVIAECDLREGRLVRPFDFALPVRPAYWLVCPAKARDRPKVRRFLEWLLAEAGVGEIPGDRREDAA
jgi:LysR family glycine cleavage system transcriptional activator